MRFSIQCVGCRSDAPSYRSKSPQTVLQRTEGEKKRKYGSACVACSASFTPL